MVEGDSLLTKATKPSYYLASVKSTETKAVDVICKILRLDRTTPVTGRARNLWELGRATLGKIQALLPDMNLIAEKLMQLVSVGIHRPARDNSEYGACGVDINEAQVYVLFQSHIEIEKLIQEGERTVKQVKKILQDKTVERPSAVAVQPGPAAWTSVDAPLPPAGVLDNGDYEWTVEGLGNLIVSNEAAGDKVFYKVSTSTCDDPVKRMKAVRQNGIVAKNTTDGFASLEARPIKRFWDILLANCEEYNFTEEMMGSTLFKKLYVRSTMKAGAVLAKKVFYTLEDYYKTIDLTTKNTRLWKKIRENIAHIYILDMRQCLIDIMTEARYKLELLQTWDELMDSYINLIKQHNLPLQLTKMGDTEGV